MTRFEAISETYIVEASLRLEYLSLTDSLLLGEAGSLAH